MSYSLTGILALIMLFISNHDVFFKRKGGVSPAPESYRNFLLAVVIFYVSDILWGVLYEQALVLPLFIDTELFFASMAFGILFLTRYAVAYMENKSAFRTLISFAGIAFCCGVMISLVINIFYPFVFQIDENCSYNPGFARYVVLGLQTVTLLLTALYAFYVAFKNDFAVRKRYLTIGFFAIIMFISITLQIYLPLLPMYSVGHMLGCGVLRVFIVEKEKEEYRADLEKALIREKLQMQELKTAWELAYTDALTGVKSKLAYIETERHINERIAAGNVDELAIAVFDLNNMKQINDTRGHVAGDKYIVSGCDLICQFFKNSPVFRIGGDEFIVILEGQDYAERSAIFSSFHNRIISNAAAGSIVIAYGESEYVRGKDKSCKQILERADALMYEQKEALKKLSLQYVSN